MTSYIGNKRPRTIEEELLKDYTETDNEIKSLQDQVSANSTALSNISNVGNHGYYVDQNTRTSDNVRFASVQIGNLLNKLQITYNTSNSEARFDQDVTFDGKVLIDTGDGTGHRFDLAYWINHLSNIQHSSESTVYKIKGTNIELKADSVNSRLLVNSPARFLGEIMVNDIVFNGGISSLTSRLSQIEADVLSNSASIGSVHDHTGNQTPGTALNTERLVATYVDATEIDTDKIMLKDSLTSAHYDLNNAILDLEHRISALQQNKIPATGLAYKANTILKTSLGHNLNNATDRLLINSFDDDITMIWSYTVNPNLYNLKFKFAKQDQWSFGIEIVNYQYTGQSLFQFTKDVVANEELYMSSTGNYSQPNSAFDHSQPCTVKILLQNNWADAYKMYKITLSSGARIVTAEIERLFNSTTATS